jgi:hypothetical protein
MVASLENRVAALEGAYFSNPVVVFVRSFVSEPEPVSISEVGSERVWQRQATETVERFRDRTATAARDGVSSACLVLMECNAK